LNASVIALVLDDACGHSQGGSMPTLIKTLLAVLMIPACFALGLYAGPRVSALYHDMFPPPEYAVGNHADLYAKAGNPIVMYSTTTCPYCAKTRHLFASKGVKFTEYQIDKSEAANADFIIKGGIGVPLLYIGERRIDGYREAAIREALVQVSKKS
jgi:glutaredoxin